MCEYILCDQEIKKGEKYIIDLEDKEWHSQCYRLYVYRDMASYKGYNIEQLIKQKKDVLTKEMIK